MYIYKMVRCWKKLKSSQNHDDDNTKDLSAEPNNWSEVIKSRVRIWPASNPVQVSKSYTTCKFSFLYIKHYTEALLKES